MGLFSLQEINASAKAAFQRFPATLLWVILGSAYCIYVLDHSSYDLYDTHARVLLTLILGVSWLIGTQFFLEQLNPTKNKQWIKLIILGLLLLFYLHLPHFEQSYVNPKFLLRFFLLLFSGHLFVLFAPFIIKWNKEAYWNYLKSIGYAILRSGFFSGVLYIGLVLALLAIQALFNVTIPDKRFGQLFIFCLGVVNTWIYLSDFPKNVLQQTTIQYNRALEVFVQYILIPLILLYIIILYAYGFKIVLQWELPKGWVSYLVTALALLGFLVQVLIHPVQKIVKSWIINRFYPWFYWLLMPLIILLFVSIFRRIFEYGITENRYLVLLTAFWILGASLYMLLSKAKTLKLLPISLFILAILSSFGFWSAFPVAVKSQISEFRKVYNEVVANEHLATRAKYEQLQSILTYLNERQAISELNDITGIHLTHGTTDSLISKFSPYNYLDTQVVLDSLGVALDTTDTDTTITSGVYYNYNALQHGTKTYPIEGFTHLSPVSLNNYAENKQEIGDYEIHFSPEENILCLYTKNDAKKAIDMSIRQKLVALTQFGPNLSNISLDDMQIDVANDSISLRLIFTDLGFYKTRDSISLNYGQALLLLKQN
jgi:hypothetical protein